MNVGEFFSSLTGRFFTEVVAEASARGLAAHANRRKPGDPLPTSVHCGPVLLALNTIGCAIICLAFGVLLFLSIRLGEPVYSVWLLVFLGGLAG